MCTTKLSPTAWAGAPSALQHAGRIDGDVALGVAEDRKDIGRRRGDGALDFDTFGHWRIVSVQRSARGPFGILVVGYTC